MQEVIDILLTSFLKFSAREKLKGEYLRTFFGAVICLIPSYLMSKINLLATEMGTGWYMLSMAISVIVSIFVIEIFNVGFIRSLIRMKSTTEVNSEESRYDAGLVLSGYSEHFGNTLKITFLRQLYIVGWSLLAYLPIFVAVGVLAFMSDTPEIAGLIDAVSRYQISPTEEAALYIGEYVLQNCPYVVFILMGAYVLLFVFAIPLIRKQYEYMMIPIILAEKADISRKEAFALTREIMHGYRWRYFCVEISFILWQMLAVLLFMSTLSYLVLYLAMAAFLPYMNMTFIEFYKERKLMLTPVEEGEDNNEN